VIARIEPFTAHNKREALRVAGNRALPYINKRQWGFGVYVGETATSPITFQLETNTWVETPGFREAWFPTRAEAQAWADEVKP
jgi:hypothetical protein